MPKNTKRELIFILLIGLLCIVGALLFTNFYKGGVIVKNGTIESRAFSTYLKLCENENITKENQKDSLQKVPEAAQSRYFLSKKNFVPPKVLIIGSDGHAYLSRGVFGGDWTPRYLYDVQLVACVGEDHSIVGSTSCNEKSYDVYGKMVNIYQAKTGKPFGSTALSEPDECGRKGDDSLQAIKEYIMFESICTSCISIPMN